MSHLVAQALKGRQLPLDAFELMFMGAGARGKLVTRTESRLLFQFAFCPRLPAKKAPFNWSLLVYLMAQT